MGAVPFDGPTTDLTVVMAQTPGGSLDADPGHTADLTLVMAALPGCSRDADADADSLASACGNVRPSKGATVKSEVEPTALIAPVVAEPSSVEPHSPSEPTETSHADAAHQVQATAESVGTGTDGAEAATAGMGRAAVEDAEGEARGAVVQEAGAGATWL